MQRLQYRMPATNFGKIDFLCHLLNNLPRSTVSGMPEKEAITLLADVILYRHSDRFSQMDIMARINALPGHAGPRMRSLILTSIMQPLWAVWSMTTEELFQQLDFWSSVAALGESLGLGISATAVADIIKKIRLGNVPAVSATALIWGFYWMNAQTRDNILKEINWRAGRSYIGSYR